MRENIKAFFILFFTQLALYLLVCVNYRAVAQTNYWLTAVSDFFIASIAFFVIKKIAKDESKNIWLWLGYALGGVVGSVCGVWVSHTFFNT